MSTKTSNSEHCIHLTIRSGDAIYFRKILEIDGNADGNSERVDWTCQTTTTIDDITDATANMHKC